MIWASTNKLNRIRIVSAVTVLQYITDDITNDRVWTIKIILKDILYVLYYKFCLIYKHKINAVYIQELVALNFNLQNGVISISSFSYGCRRSSNDKFWEAFESLLSLPHSKTVVKCLASFFLSEGPANSIRNIDRFLGPQVASFAIYAKKLG